MADWYYIGHYGQLGPLTREQMDELIEGGVVSRQTYVWRSGMSEWLMADSVRELSDSFRKAEPFVAPPPPPLSSPPPVSALPSAPYGSDRFSPVHAGHGQLYHPVRSDRSRVLAGVLQLLIPGVGRMYLGHVAYGVLQLLLTLCMGIGWLWSVVDGIIILSGGVKLDGYGRELPD